MLRINLKDNCMINIYGGGKFWYHNGTLHRDNGPAAEYINGDRSWYQNHKRHRDNGPAIEYADGRKAWYQNGKYIR